MKKLIIEIGTNSIKSLLAQWQNPGWQIIHEQVHPTRLGEGLQQSGRLSEAAMQRNAQEIAAIRQNHPDIPSADVHLIATQSLRQAANSDTFIRMCLQQCGLDIEILSGQQEAELSFRAVSNDHFDDCSEQAVLDIGGGSTELALGLAGNLLSSQSLVLGAVSLTEKFITSYPVSESEYEALSCYVKSQISGYKVSQIVKQITGVGGTLVTLLLLEQPQHISNPTAVDGLCITYAALKDRIHRLKALPLSEISALPGMPAGRADIILSGAVIALTVLDYLGLEQITVSTKGVRYGYLYSLMP